MQTIVYLSLCGVRLLSAGWSSSDTVASIISWRIVCKPVQSLWIRMKSNSYFKNFTLKMANIGSYAIELENYSLFLRISAHFRIVFDLWFGATRSQRDDSTIFEGKCHHLTAFTRRQQWFSITLTRIDSGCQVSHRWYWILATTNMRWILKLRKPNTKCYIFSPFCSLWVWTVSFSSTPFNKCHGSLTVFGACWKFRMRSNIFVMTSGS